ncbi:DUF3592 domain-containing protein [Burkholderiaceae bacterium UC74_6]
MDQLNAATSRVATRDFKWKFKVIAGALVVAAIVSTIVDLAWRDAVREAQRAQAWPSVQGTVRQSAIEQNCGKGSRSKFYPLVRYDYQVDGVMYQGQRYAIGVRDCGDAVAMRAIADRYAEGKSTTVWYKPGHAAESTLTVGKATSRTFVEIQGAEVFLAVAIPFAALLFYKSRSTSAECATAC